jgi:RNA polymerase-interacting CarD/CdnL/TRCF family regulator
MVLHEGDPVMHWTHGLGQIMGLEERDLSGSKMMYYAVKMHTDITVWVPADSKLGTRLRPPTSQTTFKKLLSILSKPGEVLPEDRFERRNRLLDLLRDGRAESLCRVVRGLFDYRQKRSLNDYDHALLKQTQNALLGEWGFVLSITPAQAEIEMHRLLSSDAAGE